MDEKTVTGTIVSTCCEGACAHVRLDEKVNGRQFAIIDDRTAGRKRLMKSSGGKLDLNARITVKDTTVVGADMVVTLIE